MIGLVTLAYSRLSEFSSLGLVEKGYGYYLLSAICWGTVMWLFEREKGLLQPSLSHSMEFLYKESDSVESWT
jgi:peroxisomal membrane protein 4